MNINLLSCVSTYRAQYPSGTFSLRTFVQSGNINRGTTTKDRKCFSGSIVKSIYKSKPKQRKIFGFRSAKTSKGALR